MVIKSILWERRLRERAERFLGVVFAVRGTDLRIRFSSCDAKNVRFISTAKDTVLVNKVVSWAEFTTMIRSEVLVED